MVSIGIRSGLGLGLILGVRVVHMVGFMMDYAFMTEFFD